MNKLTDYNYIQDLLLRNGFRFSRSMGQNFLKEDWVPSAIAEAADLDENSCVVEVGPGIGCLTRELSERAGRVISYELDKTLMPILAETLAGCENVEVVFRDFMKESPQSIREASGGESARFVANIPYNITSPLLTKVIELGFEEIIVMIQKEVAKRICARAGQSDYSAFGIFCQWHTEPEILFEVGRNCFVPQPKVDSAVIRLRKCPPPVEVGDEKLLFSLVRASFNQRRKTFVNAVSSGIGLDKEMMAEVLRNLGYDEKIRGEVLTIGDFAKITDEILTKFGSDF